MSSEWQVASLEDCLDALIDYRGKTPEKTPSGIPLVTAKVIKNGRIETPTEFIASDDYERWMRRGTPKAGDVVLTTEAPLGEVAQLGKEVVALAQRVITLRGKADFLDNTYLLYLMQTEEMQAQLKSRATGTTVLGIKQSELRKVTIRVPPIGVQHAIGSALKSIDDRITLLHETNATLEAIAQALFKSWFVDFDPVRARAEGRSPDGMDEATAALFPDGFEESELGLVPRGWRCLTLDDVSEVGIGKTPPRKETHWFSDSEGDVPWASIRDMGNAGTYISDVAEYLTCEAVERFNVRRIPENTVLMSFKLTVGRVSITDRPMTTNEAIAHFKLSPSSPVSTEYLYLMLKSFNFESLSSTSSIANAVNSKTVRSIQILVPSRELMTAFQDLVHGVFAKIKSNAQQAQTLATLRDTLLPRLISGQLRLSEAAAVVEKEMA